MFSDKEQQEAFEEGQRRFTSLDWAVKLAVPGNAPEAAVVMASVFYNFLKNGPPSHTVN